MNSDYQELPQQHTLTFLKYASTVATTIGVGLLGAAGWAKPVKTQAASVGSRN